MAGFRLQGFFNRVPCPCCESTDCCGVEGDELICARTERIVSDTALRRSALRHGLAQYTAHDAGDRWWLREVTDAGTSGTPAYRTGNVEIYHEERGVRGMCEDLAAARAWVDEHRGDPDAYAGPTTRRLVTVPAAPSA